MSDDDPPDEAADDGADGGTGDEDPPADAPADPGTGHGEDGGGPPADEDVQPGDPVEAHAADDDAGADDATFGFDEPPETGDGDAPLSDLVERTRAADDEDAVMEAFESVEVDAVDAAALWDQLETSPPDAGPTDATVTDGPAATDDGERDVQTIPIREYCMRCQYFSAPPEVRCEHAAGEILELVGTDEFRVADCPIVGGSEELENLQR